MLIDNQSLNFYFNQLVIDQTWKKVSECFDNFCMVNDFDFPIISLHNT